MSGIKLRIGADTSDLERGLSTSQKMLRDNARQMQRNIGVVTKYTAAIVAAGAALSIHLVRQTMNAVDEQSKLARSLGTSVDALTALQIAGERAGVAQGTLSQALAVYTARLGEARRGTGQAVVAFETLGLNAEELASIPLDQQMQLIGERVRGLGLDASQTADLIRNLGIRQREMIGFIREGTADIDNARAMMRQFGLEISDVDAQKIEQANDAMATIGMTLTGFRQLIAVELAGPLTQVSEQMAQIFGEMGDEMRDGVQEGVRAALTAFASLIGGAASVVRFIDENPTMGQFGLIGYVFYGKRGALIGAAISKLFHDVRMELALMGVGVENVSNEFLELVNVEKGIIRLRNQIAEINQTGGIQSVLGTVPLEVEHFEGQLESLLVRQKELSETIVDQEEQQRNFNDSLGIGSENVNNIADGLDLVKQTLLDAISNMAEFNNESALAGQNILGIGTGEDGEDQPTALPVSALSQEEREALEDRLQLLRDSRQDELESLLAYLKEKEKAILADIENEVENAEELEKLLLHVREEGRLARKQQDEREAADRLAVNKGMLNNLTTLMQTGSRELFAIGKAAAVSNALIAGQEAVTHAFNKGNQVGGPPLGFAFAATAAAATGAQISRLASTSFGSGSSGQPTTGGSGTTSTAQAQAAPQTGGQTQSLLVQGDFTQDQLFTGTTVRKLIESIAEQQRDGFTVVI